MYTGKYIFIINDDTVLEIKEFRSDHPVERALGYLEKLRQKSKKKINCYVEVQE